MNIIAMQETNYAIYNMTSCCDENSINYPIRILFGIITILLLLLFVFNLRNR